ncbi:hypothetical protein TNCV_4660101 [Trichonephila clavipes]|uniref:Uncharacterized protein n=1 Tax=Trichonephila clavipes TaxID=2585209 RepID=A0A8X6SGK0_TRICX|nr:hypothetical protein TNCV_4660101 [Trichonephila clavipes]
MSQQDDERWEWSNECGNMERYGKVEETCMYVDLPLCSSCCKEYQPLHTSKCGPCMIVHHHIFPLRSVTISMLHVPRSELEVADLFLGLYPPRTLIPSSTMYETQVATVKDLTAWIAVASDDTVSTLGLLVCIQQSLVVAFRTSTCYKLFVLEA